jgi:hypothetical protein
MTATTQEPTTKQIFTFKGQEIIFQGDGWYRSERKSAYTNVWNKVEEIDHTDTRKMEYIESYDISIERI